MKPNDEPAFPIPVGGQYTNAAQGMSLRDYFAAHAPAVPDWFFEAQVDPESESSGLGRIIMWRWAYADAMIAERKTTT